MTFRECATELLACKGPGTPHAYWSILDRATAARGGWTAEECHAWTALVLALRAQPERTKDGPV